MNRLIVSVLALAWPLSVATASELTGFVGVGFRPVFEAVRPAFERETGVGLKVSYPAIEKIAEALNDGDTFDFILTSPLTLNAIAKSSRDLAHRWDVAKNGVGIGVRKGSNKPDVSSIESLTQSLLQSSSVAYNESGPAGLYFMDLLKKLQIEQQMKSKLRPMRPGEPVPAVARGLAQMVIVVTPSILEDPGVELAGELPNEVQNYSFQTLALSPTSKQSSLVDRLRVYLTSSKVQESLGQFGMHGP